jgi:integrase
VNRPRKIDKHLPRKMYLRRGTYFYVRKKQWINLGKDLRGALAQYASILEEPKGGMADLIDAAMVHIEQGVSPNTCTLYRQGARRLKKMLKEFSPQQLRAKHVMQVKRGLAKTPSLANVCIIVLRLVFTYALENELVDDNPATAVKLYRTAKRTRLISIQEYTAIYAKAKPRLQIIMDLCIRTGQRISDVLAIRRADLTADGIRFQPQKTDTKKGIVPWTPELRAVVERAKSLNGNLSALTLLHNRRGQPLKYMAVYDTWRKARRTASIPDARIHDLRAVAATWARKQGKNPTALLMHSSPAQTERYLRDKEELIVEGPSFGHLIDVSNK